jgi:WD40 repeat protein
LAAGTEDGEVYVWDLRSKTLLKTIDQNGQSGIGRKASGCHSVAYANDGALAACFENGDVCVWSGEDADNANGLTLTCAIPSEHARHDVEFSPDGKVFFVADSSGSIVAYSANDGREQYRLKGFDSPALSLALSQDGQLLAASSSDQSIKVWDWKERRLLHTLLTHTDEVHDVSFSWDKTIIASASNDNSIKLWDVASGREVTTLWGHAGFVRSVAFSPDGRTLASGAVDDAIRIWNLSRVQTQFAETVDSPIPCVWDIEFSNRTNVVAATGDGDKIWIGDAHSAQTLNELMSETRLIHALDISRDDRWLITGGGESSKVGALRSTDVQSVPDYGNISVWDLDTMSEVAVPHAHDSMTIGVMIWQDDQYALSVASDGAVKLWKIPELRELKLVRPAGIACYSAALSPDQSLLALGIEDGTIELWQYGSDGWTFLRPLIGHDDWVPNIRFSRDSRLLASASLDQTAAIWDVPSGRLKHRLRSQGWVLSVDFSAEGKTLAIGNQDGSVRLWNVAGGAELMTLRGRSTCVFCVRFSPDGGTLTGGEVGGTIHFWRTRLAH